MELGYSPMTAGMFDLEEAFALALELEMAFLELSYDLCTFLPNAQPAPRVRELSRATGVGLTLHLPFVDLNLASLCAGARRAAVEETRCGLEYAEAVGARCAVLHTGAVFPFQPRPRADALQVLAASLEDLSGSSVPIVLENLGVAPDSLVRGPAMLRGLLERSGLGACFDFAHAFIESARPWGGADMGANMGADLVAGYLGLLGERVAHLHLCNTDGERDLHSGTPQGRLPYERYAGYLGAFGGTVCLEVAGGPEAVRASAAHIRRVARA